MDKKKSILVIYTGGTIGMIMDKKTGSLHPFDFENIYQLIPVLENFDLKIDFITFNPLIDSSNVQPPFWIRLAELIEEKYCLYHGFVVLHGTDTMAYTASALSFILENINKPVVLTGSQLPLEIVRTDGVQNIINAIEIASDYRDGIPVAPEVTICFENQLLRGNRTSKFNAENFNAFFSGNYPVLAKVGVHIKYMHNLFLKPNDSNPIFHKKLDSNVGILKLFPGISANLVTSILEAPGLKAVILETYGSGNAPTDKWFIDLLKDAIARNIIIYNVTQCYQGSVEIGKYETSADLGRIGVIGGYDITTESALTKLMFLLGCDYSNKEVIQLLQIPLRGELTNV
jgi:L-asparaginase